MSFQQRSRRITRITVSAMLTLAGITLVSRAEANGWSRKADMTTARFFVCASVVDGTIYAIGGAVTRSGLSTVEAYDPTTDTWTKKADMPTRRMWFTTSVVDGKIYAIGGVRRYDEGSAVSTVEAYDPTTDTWTTRTDTPTARDGHSSCVVDGKIYVIGGGESLRGVEEYDPATNTWTTKADMPTRRSSFATSVVDGKIYAIGGLNVSMPPHTPYVAAVEEYDPTTDIWTRKSDLPTRRCEHSASVMDGKIYVIGGTEDTDIYAGIRTVSVYDPATDTWTEGHDLPMQRTAQASCVVDGKIYAVGGSPVYIWRPESTVFAYDPIIGREIDTVKKGLLSATGMFPPARMDQPTPLEANVVLSDPLETTPTLRTLTLALSPLGIDEEPPFEHRGDGRYTLSTNVIPPQTGHYELPIRVETIDGVRYAFLTTALDVYPDGDAYIYRDGIESRWDATVSFGQHQPDASEVVYRGDHAHTVTLEARGSIKYTFDDPEGFRTSGYTGLEFWIHPEASSTDRMVMGITTSEKSTSFKVKDDLDISLVSDVWQRVHMPLEILGLQDTRLQDIWFQAVDGTFHTDDLALVVAEYGIAETATTPEKVRADGEMVTRLIMHIEPGVIEPGEAPSVTVDLTPIGGDPNATMSDGGTGGDHIAGDGIYTLEVIVPPEIPNGHKDLIVSSTDQHLRVDRGHLLLPVVPAEEVEIYADETTAGWSMSTRNILSDPAATSSVYEGEHALEISLDRSFMGGTMSCSCDDPKGVNAFGYELVLQILLTEPEQTLELVLDPFVGDNIEVPLGDQLGEPGTWHEIRIPLSGLSETDFSVTLLSFQVPKESAPFYIDDLKLVPETIPDPPTPTAVEMPEGSVVPSGYALSPNYPNPFNPATTIAYGLPEAGSVVLTVYSITGQKVATLVEDRQQAGRHTVSFDGAGYGSGIYLYRLESGGYAQTRRMVLVK